MKLPTEIDALLLFVWNVLTINTDWKSMLYEMSNVVDSNTLA